MSRQTLHGLPTNLAYLSVMWARLALAEFASVDLAHVVVDARLVGGGIGDADAGIAGACRC